MTFQFDHSSREVHLDLSLTEFDMLMVLRHASIRYIQPLKPDSDLANAVDNLDYINHQLIKARIN
jgi:hypothetical protein